MAILFVLAPLGNFLFGLYSLGYRRWPDNADLRSLLASVPPFAWILQTCVMATGVALLFVRRGSLLLATVTLSLMTLYNLARFRDFSVIGSLNLAVLILATLGVLAALYLTDFRKPYLNPRVRWWETAQRFRAEIPVTVIEGEEPFRLLDVSRTGALVAGPEHLAARLPAGQTLRVHLPTGLELAAEVVRETKVDGEARAWGLRFTGETPQSRRALRKFLSTLGSDPSKLVR